MGAELKLTTYPWETEKRGAGASTLLTRIEILVRFALPLIVLKELHILTVTGLLELVFRDKSKTGRVNAIAHARRLWAVGEEMAEMRIALLGTNFDADHAMGFVSLLYDRIFVDRLEEARPPGPGVELVCRSKKRFATDDVHVKAGFVIVPIFVGERPFRPVFAGDMVLERREHFFEFFFAHMCQVLSGEIDV